MANKTVSELTTATTLGGSELAIIEQAGSSRKVSLNDLSVLLNGETLAQKRTDSHRGVLTKLQAYSYLAGTNITWLKEGPDFYDTDLFFSDQTPTRFTIPAGVTKVRLGAILAVVASITAGVKVFIAKNGEVLPGRASTVVSSLSGDETVNVWTPIIPVTENDFFELKIESASDFDMKENETFFTLEAIEVTA